MRKGQVTIKDIAKELGISPSTVSRALKDHPDISTKTKEDVQGLAKKWDYQPSTLASGFRQGKSFVIGVVVPQIVHHFFASVLSGIQDVAYKAGYNLMICQSNESFERELVDIQALVSNRVDGLLVSISRASHSVDHLNSVYHKGIPMVCFDRISDDIACTKIIVDDYKGAYDAVVHLIDQGCTRIAHLAGPWNLAIGKNRLKGYKDALLSRNLPIDESLIVYCEGEEQVEAGQRCTEQFLRNGIRPDAIFAHYDEAAIGAIRALRNANIQIPSEVCVVGFSDWKMASYVNPPLSSVLQPGFEMGQEAARILIQEIEDESGNFKPQTVVLPARLIQRESSTRKK